jgi:dTDP-4-dehydrorhamnose 3,5-epimerase-like enzyme
MPPGDRRVRVVAGAWNGPYTTGFTTDAQSVKEGAVPDPLNAPPASRAALAGNLDDVRWVDLPSHADERGVLTAIESGVDVPFEIKRVYFVHDVETERGGHAHRETHQVVTARGRCEIVLSDGATERRFVLDDITRGLYLGPMLFIRMTNFEPGTVVISCASTHYDKSRSIRSWADYLAAIRS